MKLFIEALGVPFPEWAGTGNIKRIYGPCKQLLKEWAEAKKLAHGVSPNISQQVTYAISQAEDIIRADIERLHQIAAAKSNTANPNERLLVTINKEEE